MLVLVAGFACLLAGSGCSNDANHDADVPDRSDGDSATDGTGGTGGTNGSFDASGSGGNQAGTDPCDYVLLSGSSRGCPKCSPYSPKWEPACAQEGTVCNYLETPQGGLGASCTCQTYNENDSADGAVRMKFVCGL